MVKTYDIRDHGQYKAAGPDDYIAMVAVPDSNQLFIHKTILEMVVYGIRYKEFIHISGPTGTAKSSLVEAISYQPENFRLICKYLDFPYKPVLISEIEMSEFDTPSEVYKRRAFDENGTYDEDSNLIVALKDAAELSKDHYVVIFLKEMGRVHTASIQGALLNLLTKSAIKLKNETIPGGNVCFIADSNYQAIDEAQHTLVTLDEALKRRFSINIGIDYLSANVEQSVLECILKNRMESIKIDKEMTEKIITLGHEIRQYRSDGSMHSVVAPTIDGYINVYEMSKRNPQWGIQRVLTRTILGHASKEDQKIVDTLIQSLFFSTTYKAKEAVLNGVF